MSVRLDVLNILYVIDRLRPVLHGSARTTSGIGICFRQIYSLFLSLSCSSLYLVRAIHVSFEQRECDDTVNIKV